MVEIRNGDPSPLLAYAHDFANGLLTLVFVVSGMLLLVGLSTEFAVSGGMVGSGIFLGWIAVALSAVIVPFSLLLYLAGLLSAFLTKLSTVNLGFLVLALSFICFRSEELFLAILLAAIAVILAYVLVVLDLHKKRYVTVLLLLVPALLFKPISAYPIVLWMLGSFFCFIPLIQAARKKNFPGLFLLGNKSAGKKGSE